MAKLNIGMSFSGGGYRAATFHLGTLSFLNTIHIDDGKSLLDCISVMTIRQHMKYGTVLNRLLFFLLRLLPFFQDGFLHLISDNRAR